MKEITLYWQEKEYRFDPSKGWPKEVGMLFPEQKPKEDCGFCNWKCPKPSVMHLCGTLPIKKKGVSLSGWS